MGGTVKNNISCDRRQAGGSTYLIESVDLHCEAVDTRHGCHGLQLWDVRGKMSLEGDIVEKFVTYIRLLTVLQRHHDQSAKDFTAAHPRQNFSFT